MTLLDQIFFPQRGRVLDGQNISPDPVVLEIFR